MIVREFINLIGFKVDEQSLKRTENQVDDLVKKMENFGKKATTFVTLPFVAFTGLSLKFASDAQEVQNMFEQTFGSLSNDAEEFATNYADALNRSDDLIKESLATFQSFFIGLEFGNEQSLGFSKNMEKLRNDFSSFRNLRPEEAQQRFISALSGSAEVMDRFGINLRAAALEQQFLKMGIDKTTATATEQEKVMARMAIISDSLGRQGVIGDAIRTQREFANALRSSRDMIREVLKVFGDQLIPIAEKVLNVFIDITKSLKDNLSPEMVRIILVIGGLAAAVGPLVLGFTAIVSVGKWVHITLLSISTAAKAANISVAALVAKFVLMAAAMAAVIGLTALLVEDILIFQRGGKSLTGVLINQFDKLREKLSLQNIFSLDVFKTQVMKMLEVWQSFADTATAVFMGKWEFAWDSMKKFAMDVIEFISSSFDTMLQPFLDIINKVFKTDLDARKKPKPLFGENPVETLKAMFESFVNPEALAKLVSEGKLNVPNFITGGRNIEINNTIPITVPAGTPEYQVEYLKNVVNESAEKVFQKKLFELSQAMPENE
jgi:hypothetical protein